MEADKKIMMEAIEIAKESAKGGDYALGAVIEKNGKIIAVGKTLLKTKNDPTVHAEIVAIRTACEKLGTRFLENAVLYTTHEPCPMCASAAIWAKMKGVVFGATIEDAYGNATDKFSWRQIDIKCKDILLAGNPKLELVEEFMRKECNDLFNLSK
jgi:tRNA(Arg) A34 adenosine deaminase TadA